MGEGDHDSPKPPISYESEADIPLEPGYFLFNAGHSQYIESFVDAEHRYSVKGQVFMAVDLSAVYDHPSFQDRTNRAHLAISVAAEMRTSFSQIYGLSQLVLLARQMDPSGDIHKNKLVQDQIAIIRDRYGWSMHNATAAKGFLDDPRIVNVEADTIPDLAIGNFPNKYSGEQAVAQIREEAGKYFTADGEPKTVEQIIAEAVQSG